MVVKSESQQSDEMGEEQTWRNNFGCKQNNQRFQQNVLALWANNVNVQYPLKFACLLFSFFWKAKTNISHRNAQTSHNRWALDDLICLTKKPSQKWEGFFAKIHFLWWTLRNSNPRPFARQAKALPAELNVPVWGRLPDRQSILYKTLTWNASPNCRFFVRLREPLSMAKQDCLCYHNRDQCKGGLRDETVPDETQTVR